MLRLKETCTPTVIMVNHDMNEVAEYATKVAVLQDGRLAAVDTPQHLFAQADLVKSLRLELPQMAQLRLFLQEHGVSVPEDCLTVEKMKEHLVRRKEDFRV